MRETCLNKTEDNRKNERSNAMKSKILGALFITFVSFYSAAYAWGQQSRGSKEFEENIRGAVQDIRAEKAKGGATEADNVRTQFSPATRTTLFSFALIARTEAEFVRALEEARVDKQVGGGDTNGGSTSLVAKGSIPSILGFAVENGALTKDTNGTTITFRGNPVGIIKALGDSGFIASYDDDSPAVRKLRGLSFALSFDASR